MTATTKDLLVELLVPLPTAAAAVRQRHIRHTGLIPAAAAIAVAVVEDHAAHLSRRAVAGRLRGDRRGAPQAPQHVGQVRPEDAAIGVNLVDDHEAPERRQFHTRYGQARAWPPDWRVSPSCARAMYTCR